MVKLGLSHNDIVTAALQRCGVEPDNNKRDAKKPSSAAPKKENRKKRPAPEDEDGGDTGVEDDQKGIAVGRCKA